MSKFEEAWEAENFDMEYFDAGEEIGVIMRVDLQGRGSGLGMRAVFRHHLVIRDGRVARLRWEPLEGSSGAG